MRKTKSLDCNSCKSKKPSFLSVCGKESTNKINASKKCFIFKKGQILFHEGSLLSGLYCISSGKVKLFQAGSNGKDHISNILGEGSLLGFKEIICDEKYHLLSAEALEDLTACVIPQKTFIDVLEHDPSCKKNILCQTCSELIQSDTRLTMMASTPVLGRLAKALLYLHDLYQPSDSLSIKREDLANFVGTATETVIRLLSTLKQKDLVNIQGRKIQILDRAGLLKTYEIYQ